MNLPVLAMPRHGFRIGDVVRLRNYPHRPRMLVVDFDRKTITAARLVDGKPIEMHFLPERLVRVGEAA